MALSRDDAVRLGELSKLMPKVDVAHGDLMIVGNAFARPVTQLRANQAAMEAVRARLRHGERSDVFKARAVEAAETAAGAVDHAVGPAGFAAVVIGLADDLLGDFDESVENVADAAAELAGRRVGRSRRSLDIGGSNAAEGEHGEEGEPVPVPVQVGPVVDGLRVIKSGLKPDAKVVVASGHGAHESALNAIALGAYDFYRKPVEIDELGLIVARAFHVHALEEENRRLEASSDAVLGTIISSAPEMLKVAKTVERVAGAGVSAKRLRPR